MKPNAKGSNEMVKLKLITLAIILFQACPPAQAFGFKDIIFAPFRALNALMYEVTSPIIYTRLYDKDRNSKI